MRRALLLIVSVVMVNGWAEAQQIAPREQFRAIGLPERPSRRAVDVDELVTQGHSAADWLASRRLAVPQSGGSASDATPQGFLDSDFPIADHIDAVSPTENLDSPSIAYNPSRGEYLAVWHAFVRETGTDIYGRRLSASGAPIGDEFVISAAPGVQAVPHVAYETNSGNYWVTWTDFRTGDIPDVMIRRVSGTGQLVGSEIMPNGGDNQAFASRIACGSGRCVVTWQNVEPDGDSHALIQGYESNASTYAPVLLLTDGVGVAAEPDICFNPDDQHFTVVWQKSNGVDWDVWMFRLNRDLASAGSSAVAEGAGHQLGARISYGAGADRYLVVWQDSRSGQTWDVYGQLVGRDGVRYGGALAIYAGTYHDVRPAVAAHSSSSEFVVAFQRDISGAEQYQVYGTRVTGGGSIGGAFQIRLWYNIRTAPAIIHRTSSSEYLAAWSDLGSAIQTDIQTQRIDGGGNLLGQLVNVSVGRKGQETPATVYNPVRDEYFGVWADYRSGDDYDLYARRVSSTGVLLGQEIMVAGVSYLHGVPEVAYDPNVDEYMVVWQEVTAPATGYEIYGQRVSGLGDLRGSSFLVSRDTAAVNEGLPVVAFNSTTREYLVAWHAFTNSRWQIWTQRVSESGALVGSNAVASGSNKDAQAPRLVHNPARNEYVLVWLDFRNDRADVYGQRLTSTGARTGADLAISTAAGNKGRCDIGYNAADATYLVAWGDTRNETSDIYGQMLDANVHLTGSNFSISASGFSEVAPLVAWDPVSGDFFLAWWEYHSATDYDIWGCTVSGTGTVAGDWFTITEELEVQRAAKLSRGATNGKVLIVWQDFRNANYDIYGRLWANTGCTANATTLCLNGDRFTATTTWQTKAGETGTSRAAYIGPTRMESADSGVFFFFQDSNWEQLVKVLDACGYNGKYWVFAAATTDVQYDLVVTDTRTGSTNTYRNPLGNPSPAITDTSAFDCADTTERHKTRTLDQAQTGVVKTQGSTAPHACVRTGTGLCLNKSRFEVRTAWRTREGNTGTSQAAYLGGTRMEGADSGVFYFFVADNWEQQVKVLDACTYNGKYWVFAAATTDVEYDLTVTDTQTGRTVTYHNPLGNPSPAITDTAAFVCP